MPSTSRQNSKSERLEETIPLIEESGQSTLSYNKHNSTGKAYNEDEAYEEALDAIGWSRIHSGLLLFMAWGAMAQPMVIASVGLLFPALDCDTTMHIDSARKGYLTGGIYVGMVFGGYIWGAISDIHGRKPVIIFVNFLGGLCLVLSSLVQSYPPLLLLQFITGLSAGGLVPSLASYFIEFQARSRRGRMAALRIMLWMLGNVIVTCLAWAIIPRMNLGTGYYNPTGSTFTYNSWRIFELVCGLPCISVAFIMIFLPESPKFCAKAGKVHEANVILERLFYSNPENLGKTYSYALVARGSQDYLTEHRKSKIREMLSLTKQLFHKEHRRKFLLGLLAYLFLSGTGVMQFWFTELFNRLARGSEVNEISVCISNASSSASAQCNVTSLSSGDSPINDSIYLQTLIVIFLATPGCTIGILLIDRYNRKYIAFIGLFVSGIAIALFLLIQNSAVIVVMAGAFASFEAAGWAALSVLGLELLPTKLRALAYSLMLSMLRIGTFSGNFLFGAFIDSACEALLLTLAGLMCLAAIVTLFLPDTRKEALK